MSQPKKVRVNLDIYQELRDKYRAKAKARGLTLSEYIRRAIELSHQLEQEKGRGGKLCVEENGKRKELILL